jgi:hypothetical protein
VPAWPELEVAGATYESRFKDWEIWLRGRHSVAAFAQAWAWLVADLGDLDTGVALVEKLLKEGYNSPEVKLRCAELLYSRDGDGDRGRALGLFRAVAAVSDSARRNHCLLRIADISRGRSVRGEQHLLLAVLHLIRAIVGPIRVLITARGGRTDREAAADALRALQQTGLRSTERIACLAPKAAWSPLGVVCRRLAALGRRAEALAANGNRRALIRSHRLLLIALAALLSGREPDAHLRPAVLSLRNTYLTADDLPGAGNCSVTLAVIAIAGKDFTVAENLLATALEQFTAGRNGMPITSGAALHSVGTRLLARVRGD